MFGEVNIEKEEEQVGGCPQMLSNGTGGTAASH